MCLENHVTYEGGEAFELWSKIKGTGMGDYTELSYIR